MDRRAPRYLSNPGTRCAATATLASPAHALALAVGLLLVGVAQVASSQSPSPARASDDIETIEIWGERVPDPNLTPRPDQAVLLKNRPMRFETLGDIISELPGVALFRRGGLGAPQFLSIRGADFDQTVVLVDDVPLTGPDRGAVDFSLLPVDGFARVEIFRGSAPIRYGGGTIGGVIRLVPKDADDNAIMLRGAVGAFDTRQARAQAETSTGPVSVLASGGVLQARNNFSYLDDNATFADPTDDQEVKRENAGVEQSNAFLAASWEDGPHRLALLGLIVHQARGLPGPATVVSRESNQRRTQFFASLGYRVQTDGQWLADAFATVAVGLDRDRVRDPFGRIGLGREDTRDEFLSIDARAGAFADPFSWWTLGATAFYRRDDIRPNNRFATPGDQPSFRDLLVIAGESLLSADLEPVALSLRASLSAQWTAARLTRSRLQATELREVEDTTPNVRVEARAQFDAWTLSAHFNSGSKLPTTLQLFGNRDTVVANTALDPETSLSVDAGVAYTERFGSWSLVAEARFFWLDVRDMIVARRTSRNTIAFRNERAGQTRGFEGWAALELGPALKSTTALTLLDSTFDNSGFDRDQPLRVPVRLFQRFVSRYPLERLETFAEIDHRSGFFSDAANQVEQAAYTSINVGLRATSEEDGLSLAVSVRNLFDELGLDLLAFPRPGRSYELSIQWKERL